MPDGRIILVRHGETDANRAGCFAAANDIELTDTGLQQAEQIAISIDAQFRPSKLFSSGFRRAVKTAEVIGRRLKLEVEILEGIHERDFGCLKGQPYRRMGEMMRQDAGYEPNRRWIWSPKFGESLETVRARAVAALERIGALYPKDEAVVVSHGAVMEAISAHLANGWEAACVPPNCGIITVNYSDLTNSASARL